MPHKLIMTLVTALNMFMLHSQEQVMVYQVKYKGEAVGTVNILRETSGEILYYKMSSDIRARFIFSIHVKTSQESIFDKGRLTYSTVSRHVNGNEKSVRETRFADNAYVLIKEGKSSRWSQKDITFNVLSLYYQEPLNITKVYSDNYQQFLSLKKIKPHTYKMELPDGNYNYYTYTNGVCSRVDVFSTMYSMEMHLLKK
ncbi:MAG: hypothetical protein EOO04_12670 [Chitinophagaceae bacterium]|nr:MAG: hypothetical protein EOO04_12670 [Chitinophagaceae bacterium]